MPAAAVPAARRVRPLDLLRGVLGAGDKIVVSTVDAARAPESIRATRNVLLLSKALGTIEPELFAGFVQAIPEAMAEGGRRTLGLGRSSERSAAATFAGVSVR